MKKNTIEEIFSTIKSLKTGKSAGLDMISAEFFKSIATDIAPILKYVFNSILDLVSFPSLLVKLFYVPYIKVDQLVIPTIFKVYH